MKKILLPLIVLYLLLPTHTRANETIPAGFAAPPRIVPEKLEAGKPARVYTSLFNQSNFDLTGIVRLYHNERLAGEGTVTLPAQSSVRYWFDLTITTGTQRFAADLTAMKKTELGKIPESITLTTSSIKSNREIFSSASVATSSSSTSTTTSLITVSSPTSSSVQSSSSSTSTASSTSSSFLDSPLAKTAAEKTKNVIETITSPLVALLDKKQRSIEEELKNTTSTPLPVLDKAATELEKKTTFLKIPREQLPSIKQVYIWLIGAGKYILNTWWIMLIIFLALFRILWKLWQKIRADESND